MASRSISAILWTLISVNFLTLVVGGLITWLGYTIPVRLKQAGLLPESVIAAGAASLVVACMGICALNYSSPNALNIYACSCALFILMLVLGIPDAWYKSTYFVRGTLLLDIIYFSLLFLLLLLFVFAITLAQYMRRKELTAQLVSGLHFGSNLPRHRPSTRWAHLLDFAPQAQQQQPSRLVGSHQPSNGGHASGGAGCTCVMITGTTTTTNNNNNNNSNNNNNNNNNDDDADDNSNQNMLAADRNALPRTRSNIDRWFSRLKPLQLRQAQLLQSQLQSQLQLQHQLQLQSQTSQTDTDLGRGHHLLDTHTADRNADHYHLGAPAVEAHRRSSSSSYRPGCSCVQATQSIGDTRTLPPLVSRGVYHHQTTPDPWQRQRQRQQQHFEQRRSVGNLCASDELLADWAHFEERRNEEYDHEGHTVSQDDTSLKYGDGGWHQPARRPPTRQHHRHRASNANYTQRQAIVSECNCSSWQQQSPYTLPMINSSSSVYSISGGAGGRTQPLTPKARQAAATTTKAHSSSSVVAMTAAATVAAIFGASTLDQPRAQTNVLDNAFGSQTLYGSENIYNNNNGHNGLEQMALIDGGCSAAYAAAGDHCDYG